jgi:uncharacterized protein involved in outer membrane biogenesis
MEGTSHWRSRAFGILLGIVVLLVVIRAALPIVLEDYVNDTLDKLEGYSGRVRDIDLHLWRGAYVIEGIRIVKTGGKIPEPFFAASKLDISVEWGALLDGDVVAEIVLSRPKLNFVQGPTKATSQTEPASNWTDTVRELAPFRINRFAIRGGEVHYKDSQSEPKVDVYLQRIRGAARNLTNAKDLSGSLVATFDVRALAMGSGAIHLLGKYDPYATKPTFELDFSLDKLQLPQVNTFLKAYGNVDAERGTLSLDGEFAASKGRFEGYVKPFIDDLDVLRWNQEKEGLIGKLWEGLVEGAGELLEDQSKDRIATRIPFSGAIDDPEAEIWSTVFGLVKNAFIEALRRGVEGGIGLERGKPSQSAKDAGDKPAG